MNRDKTRKAIKLLEKAIKNNFLDKSEVQEFYDLFKENKIGIFLETGELYYCNKPNAHKLIEELEFQSSKNSKDKLIRIIKVVSVLLGVLIALIELICLLKEKELL